MSGSAAAIDLAMIKGGPLSGLALYSVLVVVF